MTYTLEVEREDDVSNRGCDLQNEGRDNIQSGGGEGGQRLRSQL
jgi:hypothetical protein